MKKLRVYADTSVYSGCFDEEFAHESLTFFEEIRQGRFILVISDVLLFELGGAPQNVKSILEQLKQSERIQVKTSPELILLRDAYIAAGVLPKSAENDAAHIASATVAECDLIVSWNFKHIVHFDKIRGFNSVNLIRGYRQIEIYSPREVIQL